MIPPEKVEQKLADGLVPISEPHLFFIISGCVLDRAPPRFTALYFSNIGPVYSLTPMTSFLVSISLFDVCTEVARKII